MKCNIVFRIYEDSHVLTLERKEVRPGRNGTFAFSEGDCEGSLEWKEGKTGLEGKLSCRFREDCSGPVSIGLEWTEENWEKENYVFAPAAVYNGNRFDRRPLPYPPFYLPEREKGLNAPPVITDIPHLSAEADQSRIQLLSGDMSVPAFGYYNGRKKEGFLLFGKHREAGSYTGFAIREDLEKKICSFTFQTPGVREENVYFFGEKEDGSGFFPDSGRASEDQGRRFEAGEEAGLDFQVHVFAAETLTDYFRYFNSRRFCRETGSREHVVPFSEGFRAVREKYLRDNFLEEGTFGEGYFAVGTDRHVIQQCWQAGWVGGGISNLPFLFLGEEEGFSRGLSTFRFILDHLQNENGWFYGVYADGICYGDAFELDGPGSMLLVRKDADLLYFLLKELQILEGKGLLRPGDREQIAAQADAFVRLYARYGQIGQFIDMDTEEIRIGNTAGPGIAVGALALAWEVFGKKEYLDTALGLGKYYAVNYVEKGILNGGPGEICQAPDSEAAFGMLEGFIQLYEATGEEEWLSCARAACEIALTWVVSYDFSFPEESAAAAGKVHTLGTVFANAQNKHSAPGICTLSGNSLLKLYRFTGDAGYLEWLTCISHSLLQFVSLPDRPVHTLAGTDLPEGYMNERVQTSDWEGKETVGGFLDGSNWPEVTCLLTYVEIPGIYIDFSCGLVRCFDHIRCRVLEAGKTEISLELFNPTAYTAVVTVLTDDITQKGLVKHNYFPVMQKIRLEPRERREFRFDNRRGFPGRSQSY